MRHGLFLPIFGELAEPSVVVRIAADAESAGWDGVFVWDHTTYREPVTDIADPWITLAAMACATSTVRIGPMITPLPRRRPVKVAREVASLDRLSGGRLTLGVGIGGDNSGELSGCGEQPDARVRGQMLDEALEILAAAGSGAVLAHRGPHYVADGFAVLPRPIQPHVPVWVAARWGNPAPLRRAARHDGVFPIGLETPDQLAELVATVDAQRTGTGSYDVAVGGPVELDPRPWQAAGATWWMTEFSPYDVTEGEVRGVLQAGPQR